MSHPKQVLHESTSSVRHYYIVLSYYITILLYNPATVALALILYEDQEASMGAQETGQVGFESDRTGLELDRR